MVRDIVGTSLLRVGLKWTDGTDPAVVESSSGISQKGTVTALVVGIKYI